MNDIEIHAEYSTLVAYLLSIALVLERFSESPLAEKGVVREHVVAVADAIELLTTALQEESDVVAKRLGVALI